MKRHPYSPLRLLSALVLFLGLALPLAACGDTSAASGPGTAPLNRTERDVADLRVEGIEYDDHGDPKGLHHYIRWSENVGQGAQPMGDIAFKHLAALGYKTVLSVDGALPELELAAKYGLRYVHVPIGYDGIPAKAALQIAASADNDGGPVYVHCHHGRHRGPCAAQILRIRTDGISPGTGINGLTRSGTNPAYEGLWKTVREYTVPSAEALATVGPLPEKVIPQGLRATMVDTSARWENLKLSKDEGFQTPKDHPDVSPAHEARMLWELFREMARTDKECKDQGEVFLAYLKASEEATIELEKAIRAGDLKASKKHFATVKGLCKDCHRDYRN